MFDERILRAEEEQKRLIKCNEMLRKMLPKKGGEIIDFPSKKISSAA